MQPTADRVPALIAYIPVIGWIYVLLFARQNEFAMFHARQSIGLFLFLAVALAGWAVITWALSWIPFGLLVGVVLFTIVIIAIFFGVAAWIAGIVYALQGRVVLLPIFGSAANRLPL